MWSYNMLGKYSITEQHLQQESHTICHMGNQASRNKCVTITVSVMRSRTSFQVGILNRSYHPQRGLTSYLL